LNKPVLMFLPSTDGMYGRTASRPAVDSALTLVRERAELHGGRIWVTSQVGVGSTFTFTIPVHRNE